MKWLLSLLGVLVVLLAATLFVRQRMVGAVAFQDDRVYVDLAVASHLNTARTFGPEAGQPVPAVRDTLWRSLLAIGGGNGAVNPRVPLVLNFLSASALLVLVMLWQSGIPGPDWRRGLAGLLLLCASPLFSQALGGTSDLLAACLVMGAAMLQVRGFAPQGWPLPPGAAVLLGLAAWLRIECVLWWPLFVAQAYLVSALGGTGRRSPVWLLMRALNGFLLMAILVAPLVAWNMRVVGVPWPQAPDGLALGAGTAPAAVSLVWDIVRQIPASFSALHANGPLHLVLARVVFWLGMVSSARRVFRREADGGLLLPAVAYVGLPVLHALLVPWIGREGGALLFVAASPLWLPSLIEGCWFIARTLVRSLRRAGVREDAWFTATRAAGVLAGVVILWGLRDAGSVLREENFRLRRTEATRQQVLQSLHGLSPKPQRVATDQPGWMLSCGFRVVDLQAHLSPALLGVVAADGSLAPDSLAAFLSARGADAVLLWGGGFDALRTPAQAVRVSGEGAGEVYLGRFVSRRR